MTNHKKQRHPSLQTFILNAPMLRPTKPRPDARTLILGVWVVLHVVAVLWGLR